MYILSGTPQQRHVASPSRRRRVRTSARAPVDVDVDVAPGWMRFTVGEALFAQLG